MKLNNFFRYGNVALVIISVIVLMYNGVLSIGIGIKANNSVIILFGLIEGLSAVLLTNFFIRSERKKNEMQKMQI